MFNFIMGVFAGLVVGLALEWMVDWSALRPERGKRESSTLRSKDSENSAASESDDESRAPEG